MPQFDRGDCRPQRATSRWTPLDRTPCSNGGAAALHAEGHRSVTIVRRYIRRAGLFEDNAAAGLL